LLVPYEKRKPDIATAFVRIYPAAIKEHFGPAMDGKKISQK
jgi:hypothetical protein